MSTREPLTADKLRRAINEAAEIASEWSSVLGEPPEGSTDREMQRVMDDINSRLSRVSFQFTCAGSAIPKPPDPLTPPSASTRLAGAGGDQQQVGPDGRSDS
jgi:hypothetical protein